MQESKSAANTRSQNHLLVHLGSSIVHLIISLVLTFYWNDADVRNCPSLRSETIGVAVMFGTLTVAYSIISAVKLIMAIAHFCFSPRSQRTITITMLATTGASAVLASIGIVVIALLSVGVGAECFDKIPRLGTLIALGVSISLNFVLFTTSLLDWRFRTACRNSDLPEKSLNYDATAMTPVFRPTSIVQPSSRDSPVPEPFYPPEERSEMSDSFDSFCNLEKK